MIRCRHWFAQKLDPERDRTVNEWVFPMAPFYDDLGPTLHRISTVCRKFNSDTQLRTRFGQSLGVDRFVFLAAFGPSHSEGLRPSVDADLTLIRRG